MFLLKTGKKSQKKLWRATCTKGMKERESERESETSS